MRTLKKLAAALLITILAASSAFAVVYGQAGYETEGYDEASAWEINNADTLIKVRDDIYSGKIKTAKYYRLTNDIDISSYRDWIPIGPDEDSWNPDKTPFNGVFDGGGHTITVNIARTNQTFTGLFGVVNGGTIKNLNVKGRIVVSNTTASYSSSGGYDSYVGGIVAFLLSGTIENCKFDGSITGTQSDYYDMFVGGIVGANNWDEILITDCKVGSENSLSKIKSSAPDEHSYASGIIGYFTDFRAGNEISNNYSRVTLEAGNKENRIYGHREGTSGRVFGNTEKNPSEPDDPDEPDVESVSIITSFLSDGFTGIPYEASLEASGTAPISWAISSGSLPPGLSLNTAGSISGTPTTEGTYAFTLKASNSTTNDSRAYFITVTNHTVAPRIMISPYLGEYAVDDLVSIQLEADGTSPITWSTDGNLPTGLSLSSNGVLYGTLSAAGSFSFIVYAENSAGKDYVEFMMDVVDPRVEIDTESPLMNGTVGESYSDWFYATGYDISSSGTWEWSATGNIPDGLTIASNGNISGTPTKEGTFSFTVKAVYGKYSAEKSFVITIDPAETHPPVIITYSLPEGKLNKYYEYQLEAESSSAVTWRIEGDLPAGFYWTEDGRIFGTPQEYGDWSFTVYAENNDGTDNSSLMLSVPKPEGGILIDEDHFPDENFRKYVSENLDSDMDGWLDASEIASITYINVNSLGIESLEGIEYFTELESLVAWGNKLSDNYWSENKKLTYLDLDNNLFTELSLYDNTALETLYCQSNQLTELDLSANTSLKALYCGNNKLRELDLSNNASLEILNLSDQNIEPFSVAKNSKGLYTVNMAEILDEVESVNPDTVRSEAGFAANFDGDEGIAAFFTLPERVTYDFDTGFENENGETEYMTVNVYPSDTPSIITSISDIPDATVGESYSVQLEALCKVPVTWSYTGDLPDGLALDENRGLISGVPMTEETGTFTVTARSTNDASKESQQTFYLTVNAPAVTVILPTITTTSVPNSGTIGSSYYASLEATGTTPLTWTVKGLPDGLSWRSASSYCYITGTCNEAGTFFVDVMVSNSAGYSEYSYALTIDETAPSIVTTSIPNGHIGREYSATFNAEGTVNTWDFSGTLPQGLSFNDGVLSGTPTEEGTFTFTVRALNDYGEGKRSFTLTVDGDAPVITTTEITSGDVRTPYSFKFEATGSGTIKWSYSGTLPDGLSLAEDGTLSGTPTAQGRYSFSVIAQNNSGTDRKTFTLAIKAIPVTPLTITTTSLPAATVYVPYTATLSAEGTAPITWSVSSDVPSGLTLSENGTLSGTPSEVGRFTVIINAKNSARVATKVFVLIINGTAPSIKTSELPEASVGTEYSAVLSADGTAPISWEIAGILPKGLSLDVSSGRIFGTPNEAGRFNLLLTASNVAGQSNKTLTLNVRASVPSITTASLPSAMLNTSYDVSLEAEGTSPIVWNCIGNLPRGLELHADGAIRGRPAVSGSFDIKITATNSAGVDSKDFTLFVDGIVPSIKIRGNQSGFESKEYSAVIEVTGTNPVELSVSDGELPTGLMLNQANRTISGTLEKAGVYPFELTASNIAGKDSKRFTITVYASVAPSITTSSKLPDAYKDEDYEAKLAAEGGDELSWTLTDGALPEGLSLDQYAGVISGRVTTSKVTTFKFTVTAANDFGSKSKSFSLKVKSGTPSFKTDALKIGKWQKKYSQTIKLSNFKATTWTIIGDLPDGLTFNKGKISGKPQECGEFDLTVVASNGAIELTQDYELVINGIAPKISGSFKKGTEGESYTSTLKAKGTTPIAWDFEDLPEGLDFSPSETGETCTISGTPKASFNSKIRVTITNGSGDDDTSLSKGLKLTIKAVKPVFATSAGELSTWTLNVYRELQFQLSKKPSEVEWSCSGTLPNGLTFDEDKGLLYGTPEKLGRFKFSVTAKNASKPSYKKSLNINMEIVEAQAPVSEASPTPGKDEIPAFENGVAYYDRAELTTEMLARIANSDEVIAAVLPAIEVEEEGMYEFTVSLDRSVPEGGRLVWHSFPDGEDDENDADNAIFLDDEGNTVEVVPASYSVTVSAWLEPGVIYEPVIAVKIRD